MMMNDESEKKMVMIKERRRRRFIGNHTMDRDVGISYCCHCHCYHHYLPFVEKTIKFQLLTTKKRLYHYHHRQIFRLVKYLPYLMSWLMMK